MTVNGKRMDQIFLNMRLFIWRIVWESNPLVAFACQIKSLVPPQLGVRSVFGPSPRIRTWTLLIKSQMR